MRMTLFYGSDCVTTHIDRDARLFAGTAAVAVDLMVVPATGIGYLLGAPVLVDIGARIDLKGHRMSLPTPSEDTQGETPSSRRFQTIPLYWTRRKTVMALKPGGSS